MGLKSQRRKQIERFDDLVGVRYDLKHVCLYDLLVACYRSGRDLCLGTGCGEVVGRSFRFGVRDTVNRVLPFLNEFLTVEEIKKRRQKLSPGCSLSIYTSG